MAVFDGCKRTPYGVVRARTSGTSGTTYSGTPLQVYSTTPVFHKFLGDMYPLVKGYFMGGYPSTTRRVPKNGKDAGSEDDHSAPARVD